MFASSIDEFVSVRGLPGGEVKAELLGGAPTSSGKVLKVRKVFGNELIDR